MQRPGFVCSSLRRSMAALVLATAAWAASCATPKPMIEPAFAARSYTPIRIALLPPDVFMIVDQIGDNDDARSAALGQAVSAQTVRLIGDALRRRGYDVDLSTRWDGIVAADGSVLVNRDELGYLANSILQFANSDSGGGQGPMQVPQFVSPELTAKVGWATQSDALLYFNLKGIVTSNGKRAAQVVAVALFVLVIAAIILALVANRNGGGSSIPTGSGLRTGRPAAQATPSAAVNGGMRTAAPPAAVAGTGMSRGFAAPPNPGAGSAAWAPARAAPPLPASGGAPAGTWAPPRGRGALPSAQGPRRGYGGGGVDVVIGVAVPLYVPLDEPRYTHQGSVVHEDEYFAGDELYISMTLVAAQDGRVLWHIRDHFDVDADDLSDVEKLVNKLVETIPLRGGFDRPAKK